MPGGDNTVADALSRLEELAMPVIVDTATLAEYQQQDEELKELLRTPSSLTLRRFNLDDAVTPLYCDCSTSNVRPYVPEKLNAEDTAIS